jgi:uncharacterized protein (TIGR02118 family)
MPYSMTLLYPPGTDKTFDENYYTTSHMPLVQKTWGDKGLLSWFVSKLDPSTGYTIQCVLIWESEEKFKSAMGSADAAKVMGDIPNYSSEKPVTYLGTQILQN